MYNTKKKVQQFLFYHNWHGANLFITISKENTRNKFSANDTTRKRDNVKIMYNVLREWTHHTGIKAISKMAEGRQNAKPE